jgi:hypothetical protein
VLVQIPKQHLPKGADGPIPSLFFYGFCAVSVDKPGGFYINGPFSNLFGYSIDQCIYGMSVQGGSFMEGLFEGGFSEIFQKLRGGAPEVSKCLSCHNKIGSPFVAVVNGSIAPLDASVENSPLCISLYFIPVPQDTHSNNVLKTNPALVK